MEILAEVEAWARNPDAPNILWIKAAPGAGKSTIASTLFTTLEIKIKRLGAGYFFGRQDTATTTAGEVWQGIAYDLARHPTIRRHLAEKMRKEEIDLTNPNIDVLFRQLIVESLSKIGNVSGDQSPVIIIDALDECGGIDGPRSTELQQLMRTIIAWSKLPSNCKLIVTSREESDIAMVLAPNLPYTIDLLVGDAMADHSKRDIHAFLREELRTIAGRYSASPTEWPGTEVIESLAIKANGLFIWASTVVQYVRRGNPRKLLEEIVNAEHVTGMSGLYTTVLSAAFPDAASDLLQELRMILATIIVAKRTLDTQVLADLLTMDPWTVEYVCNALRPVLETEGGVRFRHQSFVDFILNSDTTYLTPRIVTSDSHQVVAEQCLRIMKERLRFNICEISSSFLLNREIFESGSLLLDGEVSESSTSLLDDEVSESSRSLLDDEVSESSPPLPDDEALESIPSIETYIPSHLQYASRHWVHHVQNGSLRGDTVSLIGDFLRIRVLSWLEVASLCGFVDDMSSILTPLIAWLKVISMRR